MTVQITSLDQGLEYAREIMEGLRNARARHPAIAGGFIRDIQLGVQPKDIDIFVSTSARGVEQDVLDIGAALGCTFGKIGGVYEEGFDVYESIELANAEDLPIQLIFAPAGFNHPLLFDIGLCEAYMFNDGQIQNSQTFIRDRDNGTLTINRTEDGLWLELNAPTLEHARESYPVFLAHLRRVMEKYPNNRPVLGTRFLDTAWGREVYFKLVEEGIFGDPRTLFPAQRQELARDQIRLQDGAEDLRILGEAGDLFILDEAAPDPIPDLAQIQPRPIGANAALERLLEAAQARAAVGGVLFRDFNRN